jgi:hypothetical protein
VCQGLKYFPDLAEVRCAPLEKEAREVSAMRLPPGKQANLVCWEKEKFQI